MNPAIIATVIRAARAYGLFSMARSAISGSGQPGGESSAEQSQQRFRDRLSRGEEITDQELASAPAGHVPEELAERRFNAQFGQMMGAAGRRTGQPGGGASGGTTTAGGAGTGGPAGLRWGAVAGGAGGGANQPPPGGGGVPPASPAPGGAANPSGGPTIGEFIAVIAKMTTAVVAGVKGLELFNRGMIAVHQSLGQFDGGLAQAYATLEVGDIRREAQRAGQIGGSLSGLISAQNELRDTTYGIGTEIQGITVELAAKATRSVNFLNKISGLGDTAVVILGFIREAILRSESRDATLPAWRNFFNDVADGRFEGEVPQFPVKAGDWAGSRSARESALRGRPGA